LYSCISRGREREPSENERLARASAGATLERAGARNAGARVRAIMRERGQRAGNGERARPDHAVCAAAAIAW